jgi:hypothetical protein
MTFHRSTPAEHTAAILQEAAHGGRPVMIPGALEPRARQPAIRPSNVTAASVTSDVHTAAIGDRQRLQYEREGGGAPSERRPPGRYQTALARLRHWAVYPAGIPIADRPVPEEHLMG